MFKSLLENLQGLKVQVAKNKYFLMIVIVLLIILLIRNNSPLYDQDEAAYAGFSRVMLATKNFVSMEFPFSEPHRKPPLHFWLTSFIFYTLGENEFNLRIFPSLWIFLSCIITYLLAKKILKDDRKALLSFFILSFSLYFPLNGKIALVDSLLTFLQITSFYLLYVYFFEENQKVLFYLWIPLSLGALTKGPPIYIFTLGIFVSSALHPYFRKRVVHFGLWLNVIFSFVPLLIWGYLAWQKTSGELIRWMIDWYVLRRATNPVFGQFGPPGYYLLLFFITLFPWSIYLPKLLKNLYEDSISLFKSIRSGEIENFSPLTYFLLVSLIFSWLFYEFMMSKLPSYVLASYPIVSILLANLWIEKSNILLKKLIILNFTIVIIIHISLFIFEDKRKSTLETSLKWRKFLNLKETLYFDKDYGVPSLAYYLNYPHQEILVLKNPFALKELPSKSKIILDENGLVILRALRDFKILDETELFLYDRWKRLKIFLVQME